MRKLFLVLTVLYSLNTSGQLTLLGHLPYTQDLSDVWGYVDEQGNEYAIVGENAAVSIVDVTNPANPVEVFNVAGPSSIWRDMKTWGDYAYITNETSGGLMIIDLSPLPQSNNLTVTYFTTAGLSSAHNLYIDENGVCYIIGSNLGNGGVRMYDVASNPTAPQYLGNFENWYVHDGMARGDTLYLGNVNDGFFSIVNVSNKANPVLLGTHNTPHNFTHNIWVSDDGDYVYTTDEVSGAFLGSYNISNLNNIFEEDRIQSSPGSGVIPHNAHFINGYLVTSYYRDGLTVHDVNRPGNMVLIDRYDTSPLAGSGFNGAWGAYPWLPSGNILVTDIEGGLYILGMNYYRASYLEGNVTDSLCGTPLTNVTVQVSPTLQTTTDITGEYATGINQPGTYSVTFSATGYNPVTFPNVTLTSGNVTTLNVKLYSGNAVALDGTVQEQGSAVIPGAQVALFNANNAYNFTTDANGYFNRCNVLQGNYNLVYGKWGYKTICTTQVVGSTNNLSLDLQAGYTDDFAFDFGWTVTGNATSGTWERAEPNGTNYMGAPASPEFDVNSDCLDKAFVTGNNGVNAGDDDVDNGITVLKSPAFDLSQYVDPYISYYRWFYNGGGSGAPNDSLIVRISNGTASRVLERVQVSSATWTQRSFRVADYFSPGPGITISFEAGDYGAGHLVEAGVDHFQITGSMVGVNEDAELVNMRLYPNPSTGAFHVESSQQGTLVVTDITGKMVQRFVHLGGVSACGEELAAGVYFITLVGENGTHSTLRAIKTVY